MSYADFITLLFAFFTTMYAISTVDAQKLGRIVLAFQAAFDVPADRMGARAAGPPRATSAATLDSVAGPLGAAGLASRIVGHGGATSRDLEATLVEVRERLIRQLAGELRRGELDISIDQRGLLISIPERASFPVGSADLSDAARDLIGRIAQQLAPIGNLIRVEGHTDNVPIRTAKYSSNWDLSTARATTVVEFLMRRVGLPPTRLSAAGYGEFRPRADNASPESRARNRRVDLVVLNPSTSNAEEPRGNRP